MTTDHPLPPLPQNHYHHKIDALSQKAKYDPPLYQNKNFGIRPLLPLHFSNIFTPCSSPLRAHKLKGALSKENPKKLLEQSKSGFKITAKLNKY